MSPLEVAWGWVPGGDSAPAPVATVETKPIEALQNAIRPALMRPPCVVLFSGGCDSSLVLACALRLAQLEGHQPPVALTRRYPELEEANEDQWQELVIGHVGAVQWERREIGAEFDLVGPVAAASLRRHGVVWPPLAHAHAVDLDFAAGGSLLSGEGGDEVFGPTRLAALRALARRRSPISRHSVGFAGLALAPGAARRAVVRRGLRSHVPTPWLRPAARQALEDSVAHDIASEPLDWRAAVQRQPRMRGVRLGMETLRTLAAEAGVMRIDPLLDPGFLASYTSHGGVLGPADRTAALRRFFDDLLPAEVIARRTKATFDRTVWNEHTRSFLARWSGGGLDKEMVDPELLRQTWTSSEANALSFALLQWCWLAAETAGQNG